MLFKLLERSGTCLIIVVLVVAEGVFAKHGISLSPRLDAAALLDQHSLLFRLSKPRLFK